MMENQKNGKTVKIGKLERKELAFAAVTEVLRNNINIDKWPSQKAFVEDLFDGYDARTSSGGGFESGQLSKWLNGDEPIYTAIIDHYELFRGFEKDAGTSGFCGRFAVPKR